MLRGHLTGLWRNGGFMRLWIGQTISVGGSMIGKTAMSFTAILLLHATPFQLGLLFAVGLVPGFLTGLIAGAWADRLCRRPILIWADIGRAALLVTIPLAAFLGLLRIEQLYVVSFLVSILTTFFEVAYLSYLPSLAPWQSRQNGLAPDRPWLRDAFCPEWRWVSYRLRRARRLQLRFS
jgi:MFS family permease